MSGNVHILVVYDVTSDRRRARLARSLSYYLDRVQFSVFEGVMPAGRLPLLVDAIKGDIDANQDNVRVYRLCARCAMSARVEGVASWFPGPEEDQVV